MLGIYTLQNMTNNRHLNYLQRVLQSYISFLFMAYGQNILKLFSFQLFMHNIYIFRYSNYS